MARYLVRLENSQSYNPEQTRELAQQIRKLLGSRESIGHLRVSTRAVEFDIFAENTEELASVRKTLEARVGRILTLKPLDKLPAPRPRDEVIDEAIVLFNEERFWECHEVLELIWHPAKGPERDAIQGVILTAAAFVHYQKGENEVCLSMLNKAVKKIGTERYLDSIDLGYFKTQVQRILDTMAPRPFRMKNSA